MKTHYNKLILKFFLAAIIVGAGLSTNAFAVPFKITITNLSSNVLSPTAFISHDEGFDLFDDNAASSAGVELLAETGNNSLVLGQAASSASVFDYIGASGGPITHGLSYTVMIDADASHSLLSFMSMIGVSNDGFIGGTTGDDAINLFAGANPLYGTYYLHPDDVWDAGTEINDELASSVGALGAGAFDGVVENGVIYKPHQGILGTGDIPETFNWINDDIVAQIDVSPVPEPATLLLLSSGLLGLAGFKRKKRA